MTTVIVIVGLLALAAGAYFVLGRKKKEGNEKPAVNNQGKPEEKPDVPDPTHVLTPEKPAGSQQEEREKLISQVFERVMAAFRCFVDIPDGCTLYHYFECLTYECYYQYYECRSNVGLPPLYVRENFPVVYDCWEDGEQRSDFVFQKMVRWLFALVLTELRPDRRHELLRSAYDAEDSSRIYGYMFTTDPFVARMVASAIYAAARGKLKQFDREVMRRDVGGKRLDMTMQEIYDVPSENFEGSPFWIDFREFLPSAPGPYAPGYDTGRRATYTGEEFDAFSNLNMDRRIHEYVVENYNLDSKENHQRTVQAIADKESASEHMFGDFVTTEHYHFHAVFGLETIGRYISPSGAIAAICHLVKCICSWSREPLQSKETTPKEYGRLRPGCSWEKECEPNSTEDLRRNVLVDAEIENNDGEPSGYYDGKNKWLRPSVISSEKEYVAFYQKNLYANSYPSGHSAAGMGDGMIQMELMPDVADRILRAVNNFALSRVICRYHWTSDTENGRLVGAATSAVLRAAKDFDEQLDKARKEV